MESFTTAGLPARRRLAYWNEISSETFTALEVESREPESFEGRLFRHGIGPVALADVTTSPGRLRHTEAHIARGIGERFAVVVSLEGDFRIRWGRQQPVPVRVGDFCLMDHSRPHEIRFDRMSRTLCIVLGERLMDEFLPDANRFAGRVVGQHHGAARILVQLARGLSGELERGEASSFTPLFARGIAGIVTAALTRDTHDERADRHSERRRAVLRYMSENLHDPELRPSVIARHFGISPRTLRLLFSREEEGLRALLLRRRLEACAFRLRDPLWRGRTITEIAYALGFNNPTHFAHAFRRHFACSPRDYRRGGEGVLEGSSTG